MVMKSHEMDSFSVLSLRDLSNDLETVTLTPELTGRDTEGGRVLTGCP